MRTKNLIIAAAVILFSFLTALYADNNQCYVYSINGKLLGMMHVTKPVGETELVPLNHKEVFGESGQICRLPSDLYVITSHKLNIANHVSPAVEDLGFENITEETLPPELWDAGDVACADISGDSLTDIVFSIYAISPGNPDDFRPQVLIQQNDNTFVNETATWLRSSGCPAYDIELFDADNDGDIDLFLCGYSNIPEYYWPAVLLINIENQYFEDAPTDRLPAMANDFDFVYRVEAADINNDNAPDLVLNIYGDNYDDRHFIFPDLWLNNGSGYFYRDSEGRLPSIGDYGYFDLNVDDIDNDASLEIIYANRRIIFLDEYGEPYDTLSGDNAIFHNLGNGFFTDETEQRIPPPDNPATRWIACGDIDNDGDNDMLEVGFYPDEDQLRVLINDGLGYYLVAESVLPDSISGWFNETLIKDFDNDQYPDIFMINVSPGEMDYDKLLINNGNGSFQDHSELLPDILDFSVSSAVFDYQLDTDLDIFVANSGPNAYEPGQNLLYKNTLFDISSINSGLDVSPRGIKLLTNFPNPFNNSTLISYYLSRPAAIELSIYDIMGNLVEFARIPYHQAGNFEYLWQTDIQSSGIYFCKIADGDIDLTRKMILIK